MLVPVLLFALGLVLLIKGGDWFVDGSVGIAHRFHLPEILIGATIVSIGTTLPEVMVSANAALGGQGAIAYGNAVGSVICNTSLIAALTMALKPGKVDKSTFITPVIFFFIAAAFYALTAYISGAFSRLTGIVLLSMFIVYMVISVWQMKRHPEIAADTETTEEKAEAEKELPVWKALLLLVIGAACIAYGARLLVDNGTKIAQALGVPESVIALTLVALGTSLPELVTAITSLIKGHACLSLGNIVGANLFNLVLVNGLSTILAPFAIPTEKTLLGMNASFVVDVPLMLVVMIIMTVPSLIRGKVSRWQGITLLTLYVAYVVFQYAL